MRFVISFAKWIFMYAKAGLAEAVAIELLGKENLTNQMVGFHRESFPRIQVSELMSILSAKPIDIEHKVILFNINKLYRSGMSSLELFEATRGVWKIGARRAGAEYAMAVYQGVVREVYLIKSWHEAGTLLYETRAEKDINITGRWEFVGEVAVDIRDIYIGGFVGKGGQNPFRYVNA